MRIGSEIHCLHSTSEHLLFLLAHPPTPSLRLPLHGIISLGRAGQGAGQRALWCCCSTRQSEHVGPKLQTAFNYSSSGSLDSAVAPPTAPPSPAYTGLLTHTNTNTLVHSDPPTRAHTRMHTHTYIHTNTHVHAATQTHAQTRKHTRAYTKTHKLVHTHAPTHTHYSSNAHIQAYTQSHTHPHRDTHTDTHPHTHTHTNALYP